MYHPLVVCPGCQRHVRLAETRCPFCAVALPAQVEQRPAPPRGARLGRAALAVFGAALAASGCALAVRPGEPGDGAAADSAAPADAPASVVDAAARPDAATTPDAATRDAGCATCTDARDVVDDEGGLTFLYGAPPPPPDAWPDF